MMINDLSNKKRYFRVLSESSWTDISALNEKFLWLNVKMSFILYVSKMDISLSPRIMSFKYFLISKRISRTTETPLKMNWQVSS